MGIFMYIIQIFVAIIIGIVSIIALNKIHKKSGIYTDIVISYIYTILLIFFAIFALPALFSSMLGGNTGMDGIGEALVIGILLRNVYNILVFIFCIINPIRIIINAVKAKESKKLIIASISMFVIVIFGLYNTFGRLIENYRYVNTYYTGSSYEVEKRDYKTAINFEYELKKRGLYYDEKYDDLYLKINNRDCWLAGGENDYCYPKSVITGEENGHIYDYVSTVKRNNIGNLEYDKYPIYMYGATLLKPSIDEDMQYVPFGRFSYNETELGDERAFYNDIYIEAKIFYVDGDLYVAFTSGSYPVYTGVRNTVGDNGERNDYNYPYNLIITEKDDGITTFVGDKYYKNGSIINRNNDYEMKMNTKAATFEELFPVRKVEKIDLETINEIAKELEETVLSGVIKNHDFLNYTSIENDNSELEKDDLHILVYGSSHELINSLEDSNLKHQLTILKEKWLLPMENIRIKTIDVSCKYNNEKFDESCLDSNWIEIQYINSYDEELRICSYDGDVFVVDLTNFTIHTEFDLTNDILVKLEEDGFGEFDIKKTDEGREIVIASINNEYYKLNKQQGN